MNRLAAIVLVAIAVATTSASAAPNDAFENILVSKVNGITQVQIWPACSMRYLDHTPQRAGLELRIRVLTGIDCGELLTDAVGEQYMNDSLRLGNVDEILFDSYGSAEGYITLRFDEPQKFEVRQRSVGWIEISVDTNVDSATLPPSTPEPLFPESETPPVVADTAREQRPLRRTPPPSPPRQASRRAAVPPSTTGDFVVQLGVFDNVERAVAGLATTGSQHFAYTTSFDINDQTWHGLQVGFFESESDAESVLSELNTLFPDAWIRYVAPTEATTAISNGDVRTTAGTRVATVQIDSAATDASGVPALMSRGRAALLARRYDDAVAAYTQALRIGGHGSRAAAREMIAIAHERSGETQLAIAEYEAFLAEFPQHEAVGRVNNRIAAIDTASAATDTTAVFTRQAADGWRMRGGISHYYWRNQEQLVHDGNYLVSSSGVLGLADMTASRSGARFDVLARFSGAYQHNLVEFDDSGDVGWVSSAFVDVTDRDRGLNGRIGRQTRRQDGVPGRFDGIGFGYQWRPTIGFSASAGVPMDSPRYIADSDRSFFAASANVDDLIDGRLDVNVYTHQQTADGIQDRQAAGGELRYRDGNLSLIGLVDYDLSYAKLNNVLLHANLAMNNGWTLNGRISYGARPYLTTRNALAGQTATSVDELLETYSEGQIRTLARDRTAQATTASIGVSIPWGERINFMFDIATRQAGGTVESGGVAAIPDTGNQVFYSARAVATNVFVRNDLITLTARHQNLRNRSDSTLMADARLPLSQRLRFNPRLSVTDRSYTDSVETQMVVAPSLRVLWRRGNVLVDLEAGGRWSDRELPPTELDPFTPDGTEELYGGFVRLGYRLEF